MDEPCSALDPIATSKVEDLINELKHIVTIVMVTHNMQQAARVSDYTAFFYMGSLVEYDVTASHVHHRRSRSRRRITSPADLDDRNVNFGFWIADFGLKSYNPKSAI